jgi:TPM domain
MAALVRHLFTSHWHLRRAFPPSVLAAITREIGEGEKLHGGEIRLAIESCFHARWLLAGLTPHARARRVFADLGVWDTEHNSGVLIYVLLAERHIEIIADRGYRDRVSTREWAEICREMQDEYRLGEFETGTISGVRQIAKLIGRHFPRRDGDKNELPDAPAILR